MSQAPCGITSYDIGDCIPSVGEASTSFSSSISVSNPYASLSNEVPQSAGAGDVNFRGGIPEDGRSREYASACPLCIIPAEVLENIALEVVLATPLGPPSPLIPILCTCKRINNILCFEKNRNLYARIFHCKFDTSASRRRFGSRAVPSRSLADQLLSYTNAIQDIREGDIFSPHINTTLWTAFLMMLENDGKNRAQLDWACLDAFLSRYIKNRFSEGRDQNRGWPVENEGNSLVLWLMVMTTNEEKLLLEDESYREELITHILPYVLFASRYPGAYAPENYFYLPLKESFESYSASATQTPHGPYPRYRDPTTTLYTRTHYGRILRISIPLISTAAKLLYFAIRQLRKFGAPNLPRDRAHAIQIGENMIRPTQEDMNELNAHNVVRFGPTAPSNLWEELTHKQLQEEIEGDLKADSVRHDVDWQRLTSCWDVFGPTLARSPPYVVGSLEGLWQGRILAPSANHFASFLASADWPSNVDESWQFISVPLYMRLREHHSVSPRTPASAGGRNDGFDDGLFNAYFPAMHCQESDGFVQILDYAGNKSHYETYSPGLPNSHDPETCHMCIRTREEKEREWNIKIHSPNREVEAMFENLGLGNTSGEDDDQFLEDDGASHTCHGIQDIIVTGRTDLRHGQAWNHFKFYGRVRTWDGLIVILRLPDHPDSFINRWLFMGYLVGGQNLVGNWRAMGENVGVPGWGGAFVVSRRES